MNKQCREKEKITLSFEYKKQRAQISDKNIGT
jgi:hypothetical protein